MHSSFFSSFSFIPSYLLISFSYSFTSLPSRHPVLLTNFQMFIHSNFKRFPFHLSPLYTHPFLTLPLPADPSYLPCAPGLSLCSACVYLSLFISRCHASLIMHFINSFSFALIWLRLFPLPCLLYCGDATHFYFQSFLCIPFLFDVVIG